MGDNFYIFLSLYLFVAGIYTFRKTGSLIKNLFFHALVFASVICYLLYGISDYFTGNGIDESVIYHLKYGLAGAGFSEYLALISTAGAIIVLGPVFLIQILSGKAGRGSRRYGSIPYFFVLTALIFNPAVSDLWGLRSCWQFSDNVSYSADFDKFYKEPYIKKVNENSKNLVVIYAEGLERTYFDDTVFPGLIKELRQLQAKSTYFTNIKQVDGTGWTIGGMVASQCGIPLFTTSSGNSMAGMDEFLSGAVCLGDLLRDEGYYLTYYGGAHLYFAGKGKFYRTHGFDEVAGKAELLPDIADKSYKTGWGLFDDSLFDIAFRRFMQLSASGGKFGLFLLTLDTHHPDGHPSKSCKGRIYRDGSNPILNAVACSDYLITEFVNAVLRSPYAEKTVVVVLSDHLAMRNTASDLLKKKARKNLFMIIEPQAGGPTKIERPGSALDIGVTIMPFMGYEGAIGLGRDLTDAGRPASDIEYIHGHLSSWRPSISRFWSFPRIRDSVEINILDKTIRIDDRTFKIPVLVELNTELETVLKFQSADSGGRKSLIGHLRALDKYTPFILIDKCSNISRLDGETGKSGFCMIAGRGGKYYKKIRIAGNIRFSADEILRFTQITGGLPANRDAREE